MSKENSKTVSKNKSGTNSVTTSQNDRFWLFQNNSIVINFQPVTVLTLVVALASILFSWSHYSRENSLESFCEIVQGDQETNQITWIELVPSEIDHSAYENGVYVFKHIYLDQLYQEFNVRPLFWNEIEPRIEPYIAKQDLDKIFANNETAPGPDHLKRIQDASNLYHDRIKDIELAVKKGTYVDDKRVYVRWINDQVRYGLFASRDFQAGELLGIYTGYLSANVTDVEYAWEYNYLDQITDFEGRVVRPVIDAKHKGNLMRFSNHANSMQNADSIYIVYKGKWEVIYVTRTNIEMHQQIFVNYGEGYWEGKNRVNY